MSEFTAADLLAHADREARQLLGRTRPTDGPALAAGWPGIVAAASQVLAAIPHHQGQPAHDGGTAFRVAVSQMVTEVRAVGHRPAGPVHPSVPRIIDTWAQAAALLHRPSHPGNSDVAGPTAVRLRVARTLATVAHVTGRELQAYTGQIPQPQLSTPTAATWIRMTARHEHRALDYLAGQQDELPDTTPGHRPDPGSLPTTLAAWTALAIRATADPGVSGRDLQHIADNQSAVLNAAPALAAAAVSRGELEAEALPHLLHRLGATAAQWAAVSDQWSWVRTPDAPRATPMTTRGSGALFTALEANTRTGRTWASPSQVADRLSGVPLAPLLRTITEGSEVLADIYQQLPDELRATGRLLAPTRILAQINAENHAAQQTRTRPDKQASPHALTIAVSDVTSNRLRPLTPAGRERLVTAGAALVGASHRGHQALLAATPPSAGPTPRAPQRRRLSTLAHHHPPGPVPGPGIPR